MKSQTVIPLIKAGTPAAAKAIHKLSARLAALERIDHSAFKARTKKAFGKEMLPDEVVSTILSEVRRNGDKALISFAQRLDGVTLTPKTLRVSDAERQRAYKRTDPGVRKALELSARRISDYQQRLMPSDIPAEATKGSAPGVKTGMVWDPLQRAGLYVPAGTAPLFSTVLMIAVPAQVAGVKDLAVATPCGKDGVVNDGILCACEILGLKEVYKLGGAQAIGAPPLQRDPELEAPRVARYRRVVGSPQVDQEDGAAIGDQLCYQTEEHGEMLTEGRAIPEPLGLRLTLGDRARVLPRADFEVGARQWFSAQSDQLFFEWVRVVPRPQKPVPGVVVTGEAGQRERPSELAAAAARQQAADGAKDPRHRVVMQVFACVLATSDGCLQSVLHERHHHLEGRASGHLRRQVGDGHADLQLAGLDTLRRD